MAGADPATTGGAEPTGSPFFSVVITTYDRPDIVPRAVNSVFRQTYTDFEIIVVDDGSPSDATEKVVASFDDPRIRYHRRPNGGISAGRNTGAALARGEYLVFLDDDDEVDPRWLDLFAATVTRTSCLVACCGLLGSDGRTATLPKPLGPVFDGQRGLFLAGTFAVRADAFRAVGGFTDGLQCSHGTELALRLVPYSTSQGVDVECIDEPLMLMHWVSWVRASATPLKLLEGTQLVLEAHHERLTRSKPLLARYYAIAGVSAARLGRHRQARRFLFDAVRTDPTEAKHYLRLAAACVPPVGRRVWQSSAYTENTV